MSLHVILGSNAPAVATAFRLAERGEAVRLVSRRGGGPDHAAIERIAADATDVDRLTALTEGAVALYNFASPAYHRWLTDWPPLSRATIIIAERTGATLATLAPVYGYGPTDGPLTETTPLNASHPKLKVRADLWREVLAAHQEGRIRATEVRASDLIQGAGLFPTAMVKPLLAGKRTFAVSDLDQPHSWTSVDDVAAAMVVLASDERAWGRAWHAPTNPPITLRELATRLTQVVGAPAPQLTVIPYPVLWIAGLFVAQARELRATRYQFDRPFVVDSTAIAEVFGLKPEPLDEALSKVRQYIPD